MADLVENFLFTFLGSVALSLVAPAWGFLGSAYVVSAEIFTFAAPAVVQVYFPLWLGLCAGCWLVFLRALGWVRPFLLGFWSTMFPGGNPLLWVSAFVWYLFGMGWSVRVGLLLRLLSLTTVVFAGGSWWFVLVRLLLVSGCWLFVFAVLGFWFSAWSVRRTLHAVLGVVGRLRFFLKLSKDVVVLSWEWLVLFGELPGLFRHLRSPRPVVLPVEVRTGKAHLPLAFLQAPVLGQSWCSAEGLAHVSASGAFDVPRFRPRGRLTRRLQQALQVPFGRVGSFWRGRWTPDLPSQKRSPVLNALLACRKDGTKLLGAGAVQTPNPGDGLYVVVESSQGQRELVFPALWARLSRYACMRERTPELLHGVRARASQWFKESGCPSWVVPLALPSAVVAAVLESQPEILAKSRLREQGQGALLSSA